MIFEPPICIECVHYKGGIKCSAFPKRIPDEITEHQHDHRKPYPGDNGIRYEPIDKGGDAR